MVALGITMIRTSHCLSLASCCSPSHLPHELNQSLERRPQIPVANPRTIFSVESPRMDLISGITPQSGKLYFLCYSGGSDLDCLGAFIPGMSDAV